jgi:PAS domain S-box-containing protein
MGMRVGELSRRTGVGVSTLRAWESRFGFLAPERSPAGQRLYRESHVERVLAVLRLVAEGLTLPAAVARVEGAGTGALPEGEGEALLYGQILHVAEQGVWVSKDGRTRYANRRMAEMMGYTVEELVAIPVLEFFDPDVLPAVKARTTLVRTGERLHFTTELRRSDGSTFLAEITTAPLLNPAGRYDGAVALVNDITARSQAETEACLRAGLLDSVGEAVAAATPDGRLLYINPAAERLLGWRSAEVIGRRGREVFFPVDGSSERERIFDAVAEKGAYSGLCNLSRRDGSRFLARVTATRALDEQGATVGLVVVISDQTERDQLDSDARRRELQAETLALLGTQALRQRSEPCVAASLVGTEAVEATRRLLRADRAAVLDLSADGKTLHVRVASPPVEERTLVPAGSRSFSGYVTLAGTVVVVHNTEHDRRFDALSTPGTAPTASAIGAPIFGPSGILGVLTAESAVASRFDQGDGHFIQAMANIVGTAILD